MQLIRNLSQRQVSLALAIYIGLILNSAILLRNGMAGDWLSAVSAVLSAAGLIAFCYFLLGIFSLTGKTLYKIFASVVLLASAAASYYMTFFNVVIGYGVIVSTLTLDMDLHTEALGYKCILWLALTGALPTALLWYARSLNSVYERRWSGWLTVGKSALPIFLSLLVLTISIKTVTKINKAQAQRNNLYTASVGGVIAHSYLPTNWLAGLALYSYQQIHEEQTAQQLFDPTKHFTYQASPAMDELYVVFVIGETTRWDHMGLFGYDRATTPLLAQEKNLIALRGTSCDTATKLSLRCMFVRENGTEDNSQRTLKERNVFAVLRKLGFTSELFGMQSEAWFYSSIDANSYEVRELIASAYSHTQRPIDDMLLVDQLEKSLHQYPQGKHLVVLHTKGSHHLYSQRYPREFARFTPECDDIDNACSKQELINAFDNSILYIDYMLKNVFDKLRNKNALVFYVPDHGESIDEGEHFHATPKEMAPPEQFRVPFIVWASDKFINNPHNAQAYQQLTKREAMDFNPHHQQLFDSLLGCMGFTSPDGGINQNNNWCSENPRSMALDQHTPGLIQR